MKHARKDEKKNNSIQKSKRQHNLSPSQSFVRNQKILEKKTLKKFALENPKPNENEILEQKEAQRLEKNRKARLKYHENKVKFAEKHILNHNVPNSKNEIERKRYDQNKAEINSRRRDNYEQNKTEINSRRRDNYEQNKAEINSRRRENYEQNKIEINDKRRENYEQNKIEINDKRRDQYDQDKIDINATRRALYIDKKQTNCEAFKTYQITRNKRDRAIYEKTMRAPRDTSSSDDEPLNKKQRRSKKYENNKKNRLANIKQDYFKQINQLPDQICPICIRLLYPDQVQSFELTQAHLNLFNNYEFDEQFKLEIGYQKLCFNCLSKLKSMKVPSQAIHNQLYPGATPKQLNDLNEISISLCSRVKPFMKIHKINTHLGQSSMKGNVVHFAQEVEEIHEQLPLSIEQSNNIIVKEKMLNIKRLRQFSINPNGLQEALKWLSKNNCLYKNVKIKRKIDDNSLDKIVCNEFKSNNDKELENNSIVESSSDEACLSSSYDNEQTSCDDSFLKNSEKLFIEEVDDYNAYVQINNIFSIMHGNLHQGESIFGNNAGRQCTAIAAYAICYSQFKNVTQWNSNSIDTILLNGNLYFTHCDNVNNITNAAYLSISEVLGEISIENKKYSLLEQTDFDQNNLTLGNLTHSINLFVASACSASIFIVNEYSVCIIKNDNDLFLFDSHQKSPTGRHSANGKASVMQFHSPNAANKLAKYLVTYYKRKNRSTYELSKLQCLETISKIVEPLSANQKIDGKRLPQQPGLNLKIAFETNTKIISSLPRSYLSQSPNTTYQSYSEDSVSSPTIESNSEYSRIESNSEYSRIESNSEYSSDINLSIKSQNHNSSDYIDSFSTALFPIDRNEPDTNLAKKIISAKETLPVFDLERKTTAPINSFYEKRLEELAFIKLFPFGINGFSAKRETEITMTDYVKTRMMSSDLRFQNNEYLFYMLARLETEKLQRQISICTSRLRNGDSKKIDNLHVYMRQLRGYSSYWNTVKGNLMAFLRTLGEPHWFVTLSARDLEWNDMINALLFAKNQNNSKRPLKKLINNIIANKNQDFVERSKLLHDYPVVAARHFNRRFKCLMKYLLKDNKIFGGKIKDYWYRIEFQLRGSPHVHMLVWTENNPDFSTTEGIKLLENVVTCEIPQNEELKAKVLRLQKHKCTHTCFKNGKTKCRFGFPLPVSSETKIITEDELKKNNGKSYILKRNEEERWINPYNPTLLELWDANHDIQPVGSLFGLAYYIAKYCSKEEPQQVLSDIQKAINSVKHSNDQNLRKEISKATRLILKNRERSAQEAAYILCGLRLKSSSRSCVFVNSVKPEKRTRLIKNEAILNPDYDENDFCSNIFDKYQMRPKSLEKISLAEFATEWQFCTRKKKDKSDFPDSDSSEEEFNYSEQSENEKKEEKITYKLSSGIEIKKRNKPAILKIPYISINDNPEDYYYSLLVLYFPFRDEKNLLFGFKSSKEALLSKTSEIETLHNNTNSYIMLKKQKELQNAIDKINLINLLDESEFEQNKSNETDLLTEENLTDLAQESVHLDLIEECTRLPIDQCSLTNRIRCLNEEQLSVINYIKNYLKSQTTDPLRIAIHGQGGTGKSFVAHIIADMINLLYDSDPLRLKTNIMIAAPTGVAAKNISGRTIHNAFNLPIEKHKIGNYLPLNGSLLERQREKWRTVNWLIIDEISMISYETLRMIHLRLCQFKNNDLPFGGVNIILMGDLLQLKPVYGSPIFKLPLSCQGEEDLWKLYKMFRLEINQRQKGDQTFGHLCARVRIGQHTAEDLQILNSRLLENLDNKEFFDDAIRLCSRKKTVNLTNQNEFQKISSGKQIYVFNAVDTHATGSKTGQPIQPNLLYKGEEKTGGIINTLKLSIGCRVMLRRNMDVALGLVNGSLGTVTGFEWPLMARDQQNSGDLPEAVLIKFDDPNIAKNSPDAVGDSVRIKPINVTFDGKQSSKITRRMLPLIFAWAVTIHKCQGMTLEKAIVELDGFNHAMEYVALSRVKTLDGLAISKLNLKRFIQNNLYCKQAYKEIYGLNI